MRLDTANIITAARVACGRWYKNGDKYNNVIPTSNQVITDENQVWAHDLKLTALLENDQLTGYQWKAEAVIFPSHWPMSSLFADMDFLDSQAIDFAILTASAKPSIAIVKAAPIKSWTFSQSNNSLKNGNENHGNQIGIDQTTLHHLISYHTM